MADRPPQSFATHRRIDPYWHVVPFLIVLITLVGSIIHAWRHPSLWSWWQPVFIIGLAMAFVRGRAHVTTVQDRVIRLEMRLRLREVLPPPLAARARELSSKQLVGLRFASDAELPRLVERCLNGELRDHEAVKKEVRDWQPDFLRA